MAEARTAEPTDVQIDRGSGYLSISWQGGHVSVYPLAYLRLNCPCAACRADQEVQGGSSQAQLKDLKDIPLIPRGQMIGREEIQDATLVGRYALRLVWKDGHDAGIFPFEYLRSLCQCEECRDS